METMKNYGKEFAIECFTSAFENFISKIKSEKTVNITFETEEKNISAKILADNKLVVFKIEYSKSRTMTLAEAKAETIRLKDIGMTQAEIAIELGLSQKTISNYINNKY